MRGTWRAAWLIAGNDLRRRVRDRSLLIQGVLAPVGLGLIVGVSFGGGPSFSATIGVADATGGSAIAAAVVDSLTSGDATGDDGDLAFVAVDAADVRPDVTDGTLDAALVVVGSPENAVYGTAPVRIDVVGSAGSVLSTSIAESVASSVAASLRTTKLAAGTTVTLTDATPGEAEQVFAAAQGLTPAVVVDPQDVQSNFSIISYFAPAMAMLFLFFTIGTGARSVISERREGTLSRIRAAPVSDDAVLVGKTLGVVVLGSISLATVWAVTALAFGVDWGDPVGVAAVLFSVVIAIAGIALFVTGIARTENQADAMTTIVALGLAVLGGSFFFGASGLVARLKVYTPNGQALNALTELSAGEGALLDVLPTVLLLLLVGVVTGAVGVAALRKKVAV
ncbi:MAG: ABC transporter permease [Actinomycetota bacterium]|nr:ABC transporter permease [Actinomycetota bacterium]MDH4353592.1 ABC transporter permease [Actinomycetota bacterium]